jgi:rhodanese-related sulfurtransferase
MSTNADTREIDLEPARVATWMADDAGPQVIDVREADEREAGHIEGTRHIRLAELTARADSIERNRPVVFYCRVGARSELAAQAFRASGFEAYTMIGGLIRWVAEGRPLTPEGGHVAGH